LASGSRGNSTYIGDGHAGILIDCGVSTKQILTRMEALGLKNAPIDGVLVTHEHSDHVGAARILSNKLKKKTGKCVPFFMTRGTSEGLRPNVIPEAIELIEPGEQFKIRHLSIDPFMVPHDTRDPVGYRVCSGVVWAGVVTDLGRSTNLVERKLRSLSVGVVEFNHDVERLIAGTYPWSVKQRIRSSHGHLSNQQAADLLSQALPGSSLKHLILGHLSERNNTPALAFAKAAGVLNTHGVVGEISLRIGHPKTPLPPASVPISDW
jgi:phosphoribosyl 1,2-cyclic phosphodiesterase